VFAEYFSRVQVSQGPEETLGRMLVVVFAIGMAFGLALNLAFACWISVRLGKIERWMAERKN